MVTSCCCKRLSGGTGDVQVRTNLVVTECHRCFGVNYHCGDGIQSKFGGRLVLNDAGDSGERLWESGYEVTDQDIIGLTFLGTSERFTNIC